MNCFGSLPAVGSPPGAPGTPRANGSPEKTPSSTAWADSDQISDSPDLEVAAFQELLVFTAGSESKPCGGGCWTDPDNGATGKASHVTAVLERAPVSFNAPCKMKREFRPPFLVAVTAMYPHPCRFDCKASCYMLNDHQLENLTSWRPDFHEEVILDGREMEGQAWSTAGEGNYEASIKLEFSLLKFVKPTRMARRYILFFLELSFGVNLLLVYKKPTVVISRNTDQINKALLILKGIQPVDGRSLRGKEGAGAKAAAATEAAVQMLKKRDAPHEGDDESDSKYYNASVAADYMIAKFNEAGIKRPLSDSDITLLLEMAGYNQYDVPAVRDPTSPEWAAIRRCQIISENQWAHFTRWFERKFLPGIKAVQSLWDQRTPYAICPLSTDRAGCESALAKAPEGTFFVRARLKLGSSISWVISCCESKEPGTPIRHILLMPRHLELHSLQMWVRDLPSLLYCMDITSGAMLQKEKLFLQRYNRTPGQREGGDGGNMHSMPTAANAYHGLESPISYGEVYAQIGHGLDAENYQQGTKGSPGFSWIELSKLSIDPEEGDKAISNWVRTGNYRE